MPTILVQNFCKFHTFKRPLRLFCNEDIKESFLRKISFSMSNCIHIIHCKISNKNKFNPCIRNLYYQHKYSRKVEAVVNQQIQAEQQAAQDYLNLAVIFLHPGTSHPGAGGFFMKMYKEELVHMQDFISYQLLRGGTPLISGLKPPNLNKLTLLEAFKYALSTEKTITELLENVISTAEAENDYQCADFVTSIFLAEQMRSVNEISHHVTKLSLLGNNEHAIYHYDVNLVKSYPYSLYPKYEK